MGTRASSEGTSKQPPAPLMSRESRIYTLLPPSHSLPWPWIRTQKGHRLGCEIIGQPHKQQQKWGTRQGAAWGAAEGGPCCSFCPFSVRKYDLSICPRPWLPPLLRAGPPQWGAPENKPIFRFTGMAFTRSLTRTSPLLTSPTAAPHTSPARDRRPARQSPCDRKLDPFGVSV